MAALIRAALKYTPFGRWLMLSGSNPLAALYAGFPRTGVVTATYALSGTLSGLSGVIIAARNVNVKWDYGASYLLIAILIAVMAGVRPEGIRPDRLRRLLGRRPAADVQPAQFRRSVNSSPWRR